MIFKTDGEAAMIAMQRVIAALRPGLTRPENPPAYNPSSNGACEKGVQDVSSQIRTLTIAVESILKIETEESRPVMDRIV